MDFLCSGIYLEHSSFIRQSCPTHQHLSNLENVRSGSRSLGRTKYCYNARLQASWLRGSHHSVLDRANRFAVSYPLDDHTWPCCVIPLVVITSIHLYPVYPPCPVMSHTFWHLFSALQVSVLLVVHYSPASLGHAQCFTISLLLFVHVLFKSSC